MTPESDLYNWTLNADRNDLQVSVHAIGDRAVNIILNVSLTFSKPKIIFTMFLCISSYYRYIVSKIFERVINESRRPNRDRRFRVEHAQSVIFSDQPRFHLNNIVASVQPYHIIDDGFWTSSISEVFFLLQFVVTPSRIVGCRCCVVNVSIRSMGRKSDW